MTHLYIELNTGLTEEVNSSIISKLYELAISGDLDETSDLKGRLHSSAARDKHIEYLNNSYSDLYIAADTVYLTFDDPLVEQIILNLWGNGAEGITKELLGLITEFSGSVFGSSNITSFNEYKYFGSAPNQSNTFDGCSLLTSIEYPTASPRIVPNSHRNNSSLTHVKIDNTNIATICMGAFNGCSSLLLIVLPTACTTIEGWGFANCTSLSSINLSNITTIGSNAFENCTALPSIDLSNVTSIGQKAFGSSSISSVVWSDTVTEIPSNCFINCKQLTSISNTNNVTTVGGSAFQGCTALTSINLSNITTIYGGAFRSSSISGAISLSSLTTASGEYEFYDCANITSISSIGSIIDIDHHMFHSCTGLTQIPDLSTVTGAIGYSAFEHCISLRQAINIPNVTTVSGRAFANSAISSVTLGQSCTGIDKYAFTGCSNLTSITIPKNVAYIELDCFTNCPNLSSVSFESGSNLKYIGAGCFNGCNALQSIIIPNSCEEIQDNCFYNCINLNRVEIGSGIQSIANSAFALSRDPSTSTILTIHATTPPTFPFRSGKQALITAVYVPTGCVSVYEQHSDWSRFSGIIREIPQS